jgi:hypothetical protein
VRKSFNAIATLVAAFFCLPLTVQSGSAQSAAASASAARDPEYQALFRRMYANPRDMEATFRFAEVATRLGDYEAAIGALERVLFFNPNLARVKVQLGALYLRIGGNEVARAYLSQAIATPGAPPDVVATAQQLLTSGGTLAGASGFHLYVNAGWRYQTNASAGPSGSLIRSFGDDAVLNNQFGKAPDWNHFILTTASYSYDLGSGISAEAGFFGYYAKQIKLDRFDLGLAEVQIGPRFGAPWLFSDGSFKIYAIGTASWLAEDPYYSGPGAGVSARFALANILLEPFYEYRDRDFKNSELYPNVSEQTGKLQIAALTATGATFGLPWFARIAGSWNRTDVPAFEFNSYDRFSADIAFPMPFSLFWWGMEHQFVFTPTAGYSKTDYSLPNPTIDPNIVRADTEWRVGAAFDIQVYEHWGIRTLVQYSETSSNLPNFDMKNLAVSFGPTFRF